MSKTCVNCKHDSDTLDAGGYCNQLVLRGGVGDPCGCRCVFEEQRDGTVGEVIDQRVQVYGNPVETFARIAEVWSGILGVTVDATDVPLCLIGMKLVRTTQAPDYSDNSDDVEGYLDIFRQLVGEDMIHARSVKEYVELKQARDRHAEWAEGVAADNARQSKFYAENDPSIPARPEPDEVDGQPACMHDVPLIFECKACVEMDKLDQVQQKDNEIG